MGGEREQGEVGLSGAWGQKEMHFFWEAWEGVWKAEGR